MVFHWIYKPFIYKIFSQISTSFAQHWKKWSLQAKDKKGNCYFSILSGWTFACHILGCIYRIFLLSCCHKQKRFFMPLQEFVAQFKTRKNLQLTLKNTFVCFWLFKRWQLKTFLNDIVEKRFWSCCVRIWRQLLRWCETISLSLVFNLQFRTKYLTSFTNQNVRFHSIMWFYLEFLIRSQLLEVQSKARSAS